MTARCIVCGREFHSDASNAKCCSPACRKENKRSYSRKYSRQYYANNGVKWHKYNEKRETSYRVVFDPTGDFPKGNILKVVRETLRMGHFADGTILEKSGVNYEVRGKRMVKV